MSEFPYPSAAYPHDKIPVSQYTIANAIASYIRTLISFNGRGIRLETQTLPADHLHLSKAEKKELIMLLQALTDTSALLQPGQ